MAAPKVTARRRGFKIFWEPIAHPDASTSERSIGLCAAHMRASPTGYCALVRIARALVQSGTH
jgi:hypothetical protein